MRTLLSSALGLLSSLGCQTSKPQPIEEGSMVPDLKLKDHQGREIELRDKKSRATLLYFYPKDNTPGCTLEAQNIRDRWEDFGKAGIRVLGVSTDGQVSHAKFAGEQNLPFSLIPDEKGELAKAFSVPLRFGFAKRMSFLWDASGRIRRVYPKVEPRRHAQEVLQAANAI